MHNIFVEKPYAFVPALAAKWPQRLYMMLGMHRWALRKREGIIEFEVQNESRIRDSINAGHGVLLTANHSRMADPGVMYEVATKVGCPLYTMASWHLFNQSKLNRFLIRLMGAFSVNREGMDRHSIDYAVKILQTAERPLVIFPEGTVSRTNDRLMEFMDGPAFIARTAAKRRKKEFGDHAKVVIHPIAIKYVYQGDIAAACGNVLSDIEKRLSWSPQDAMPLVDRLVKVGDALLKVKELQYECEVDAEATIRERQNNMVEHLLAPLEEEWLGSVQSGGIQIRVKNLRLKIFPEISRNELDVAERRRRWEHLERTYLAQQIDCYPENYVLDKPYNGRILETVEKFEEDFTDVARIHGQLKAIVNVGEAMEVPTKRDRSPDGATMMSRVRSEIQSMLDEMQSLSEFWQA